MERRQLEYFLAIAEHGSFGKAARELHVSQPALSQAMRDLELELGTALFERLPRGILLTTAGEVFSGPAGQTLRDMETAKRLVRDVAGLDFGWVEIVTLAPPVATPLAAAIRVVHQMHPSLQFRVSVSNRSDVASAMVANGEFELGFVSMTPPPSLPVLHRPLNTDRFIAVLPPGTQQPASPLRGDDLLEIDWVIGPKGTTMRDFLDAEAAARGRVPRVAAEVNSAETVVQLILEGVGCGLLSESSAGLVGINNLVRAPLEKNLFRQIYAVWRTGEISPAVRAMLRVLEEQHPQQEPPRRSRRSGSSALQMFSEAIE